MSKNIIKCEYCEMSYDGDKDINCPYCMAPRPKIKNISDKKKGSINYHLLDFDFEEKDGFLNYRSQNSFKTYWKL